MDHNGNIGLPPLARVMGVGRQQQVPMGTEKVMSKINEVDSKVEDRFLKHELQMQLMVENMEGIMQMIAHGLDT